MMLKEELRKIVRSQREEIENFDSGIERDELQNIDINLPYAIIISGVRRCGKSTLLCQILKKLSNFYYLNLEDPRLSSFETGDFEKLDEVFVEEYGVSEFYFLDEIQNVESWELFVRFGLDRKKHFIITGSNASLLSKELGTRLTGRHVDIKLFPFNFREFVRFKKIDSSIDMFKTYISKGGFPDYIKYDKNEILRELFTDIIQRDIVARYGIKDSKILKEIALYLLTNVGKEFSYNSLKKIFGLGSVNTVISYISYLEDSYLLFTIPKFDYSLKKQLINQKKVYSIDNGLSTVNTVSFSSDKGRMLENLVFLSLKMLYEEIFYFKEKTECDFLIKDKNKIKMAVQVTYELNNENKERELNGLVEALEKFGFSKGLILTNNQEEKFIFKEKELIVKPFWKWFNSSQNF